MRDDLRKYGYSARGKPGILHKLVFRDNWVPAIVAMMFSGNLDYKFTQDTVDSDEFKDFVDSLLQMPMNFNERNPNSIAIFDNCVNHHANDIAGLLREVGGYGSLSATILSNYNPIEEASSKIKMIRKCM